MQKLLALFVVVLGFTAVSFGQVTATATATATASATILNALTITKNVDMNFGNIFTSAAGGSVILTPAGGLTATGVTIPTIGGTVAAAEFTVTGTPGYAFTFTVPTTVTTVTSGSDNMTVDQFTHNASGTMVASQVIKVGARLNVGASQASGVYTSATPFTVTVNYN